MLTTRLSPVTNQRFLATFKELDHLVSEFRDTVNNDPLETDQSDKHAQVLQFKGTFEPLANELGQLVASTSPDDLFHVMTGSKYNEAFMESSIHRRSFMKPRGYAGDAVTMEMVYKNGFDGTTTFGQIAHNYYTEHLVSCQAVRNRKDYIKQHIASASEGAQILSVAAGPAREIHEYLLENPTSSKSFLAVDHDMETLDRFRSLDSRMNYTIGNAFSIIRGERRIAYPLNLPFLPFKHNPKTDFKGMKALLAPLLYDFGSLELNHYELVYSADLYDYIESFETPQKGTKALTKHLFDLVAPGGKLVIGNASTKVPNVDIFVFASAVWPLLYREDQEIMGFADAVDRKQIASIKIEKEPLGWNSFLVGWRPRCCPNKHVSPPKMSPGRPEGRPGTLIRQESNRKWCA